MSTYSRPLHKYYPAAHSGPTQKSAHSKHMLIEFWVACVSMLAAIILAISNKQSALLFATGGALLFALIIMQAKSHRNVPLPLIPILVLLITGVTGYLFYPDIARDALVSLRIDHDVHDYKEALGAFTICAAMIFTGATIVLHPAPRVDTKGRRQAGETIIRLHGTRILWITTTPLLLFFYAYRYQGIIERSHHLEYATSRAAVSISSLALPLGVCLVTLVLVNTFTTRPQKLAALFLLLAYTVAYVASGSRGLAFVPASLLMVTLLTRSLRPISAIALFSVTLPLIIWGVSIPLEVRVASDGAGILPTLRLIANDPSVLTSPNMSWMLGNILFGLPLAGQIIGQGELPGFGFWTSVSPLPSGLTRWGELQPLVSWAPSTPYNAIGELAVYGLMNLILYMFAVGLLLGHIDNWIAKRPHIMRQAAFIVSAGACMLFSIGLLQYPLRNSSRYLWYLVLGIIAVQIVQYMLRKNQNFFTQANGTTPTYY